MAEFIALGELRAEVTRKAIKHVHLSVLPPHGKVRIAAPLGMSLETIRVFAISKMEWIRRQQGKLQAQDRETPREYLERESHYVWGKRYLLKLVECDAAPQVILKARHLQLQLRPGSDAEKRQEVLDAWYRQQLRDALPALLARWEPLMGVKAERVFIQRMKTKWGSCNPASAAIRLNTDLAKKPPACLEYILVHELTHLIEPSHNARFIAAMDMFMPKWRHYKDKLNRLPIRHEDWGY